MEKLEIQSMRIKTQHKINTTVKTVRHQSPKGFIRCIICIGIIAINIVNTTLYKVYSPPVEFFT